MSGGDLLDLLHAAGGSSVGVDSLAGALSIPAGELTPIIDSLRRIGYVIERTHPHGTTAYRLLETPDLLLPHEIARNLDTRWVGCHVECVDRCESTNGLARSLALEGARHGTLILAEEQSAGRGRGSHRWHSPRGVGLYMSLVLRPKGGLPAPGLLQITTGVALAHAVMKVTGKKADLRWPNDVLMGGGKVAGLLVDAIGNDVYVVGVGLNVNHPAGGFPEEVAGEATSLEAETGGNLDRVVVLRTLLASLEEWYDHMAGGAVEKVAEAWRPLSSLLGRVVTLMHGASELVGRVTDLSPVRGVRLSRDDGHETWLPAEEVSLIRPVQ